MFADVFNLSEEVGIAPSIFLSGDVSLIPKKAEQTIASSPLDLRPITVQSVLDRWYKATRLRVTIFDWQERMFAGPEIVQSANPNASFKELPLKGCRSGCSPKDLTWPLAVAAEKHLLGTEDPYNGCLYDLEKGSFAPLGSYWEDPFRRGPDG